MKRLIGIGLFFGLEVFSTMALASHDGGDAFILRQITWIASRRDGRQVFVSQQASFKERDRQVYQIGQARIVIQGQTLAECVTLGSQVSSMPSANLTIMIDENRYRYQPNQNGEEIVVPAQAVQGCGLGKPLGLNVVQ